jgi:hypothetical protein
MSKHRPAEFVPDADSPRQPRRKRRAVIDPAGVQHESLIAAAVAHDSWPSAVHLLCTMKRRGWRFADEAQGAAPTPDSAA